MAFKVISVLITDHSGIGVTEIPPVSRWCLCRFSVPFQSKYHRHPGDADDISAASMIDCMSYSDHSSTHVAERRCHYIVLCVGHSLASLPVQICIPGYCNCPSYTSYSCTPYLGHEVTSVELSECTSIVPSRYMYPS